MCYPQRFFKDVPGVLAAVSLKEHGNMKNTSEGAINREEFLRTFFSKELEEHRLIFLDIAHSSAVVRAHRKFPEIIKGMDGIVSADPNIAVAVTYSDCLPVFFLDPVKRVIGLCHAGYKGVYLKIVLYMLSRMVNCGSDIENIQITLGPSICGKCYVFDYRAPLFFRDYPGTVSEVESGMKYKVDLPQIIKYQLTREGMVPQKNIIDSGYCTFESSRYFSNRRDNPGNLHPVQAGLALMALV